MATRDPGTNDGRSNQTLLSSQLVAIPEKNRRSTIGPSTSKEGADEGNSSLNPIEGDLVCSVLAVNLWSLNKALSLRDALDAENLFDMESVSLMSVPQVYVKLLNAGCSRGDYFTGLLAERLFNIANALKGEGLERLRILIAGGVDTKAMDEWLLSIQGVGPHVLRNFKILQGLEHST